MTWMRSSAALGWVVSGVAIAAGAPCSTDRDCPGEEVCEARVCAPPAGAAAPAIPVPPPSPPPGPIAPPPVPAYAPAPPWSGQPLPSVVAESEPPEFAWALQFTADYVPTSSVNVPAQSVLLPGQSKAQMAFFGVGQLAAGVLVPSVVRVLALLRGGYGSGGIQPGKGSDAIYGGGGLYLGFQFIPEIKKLGRLEPFLRATYDKKLFPLYTNHTGTTADSALGVAVGILAWNGQFGLHLGYGGDAAGGTSISVGATIGIGSR